MMRVLLIKTSSMGDIIHTLPALTDAGCAVSNLTFDWVVEDSFAEIPSWHPLVNRVIPVALRRWRKGLFTNQTRLEWKGLRNQLKECSYDLVLDAQGLAKSAFLTLFARGVKVGLNWQSARESVASLVYQRKYAVNFYQHAIVRMRSLFSHALGYELSDTTPDFGLSRNRFACVTEQKYVVFLHGTTWETKQWPELYWRELALLLGKNDFKVKISGGNQEEVERARRIANDYSHVEVLPLLDIGSMAKLVANATVVVAVDTGFAHLAAALDVPSVSIYGATDPQYTGTVGRHSRHLAADFACAPCLNRLCTYKQSSIVFPACFETISPLKVFAAMQDFI